MKGSQYSPEQNNQNYQTLVTSRWLGCLNMWLRRWKDVNLGFLNSDLIELSWGKWRIRFFGELLTFLGNVWGFFEKIFRNFGKIGSLNHFEKIKSVHQSRPTKKWGFDFEATMATKQPRRSDLTLDLEFIAQNTYSTMFVWTVLTILLNFGRRKKNFSLLKLSSSPQLKSWSRDSRARLDTAQWGLKRRPMSGQGSLLWSLWDAQVYNFLCGTPVTLFFNTFVCRLHAEAAGRAARDVSWLENESGYEETRVRATRDACWKEKSAPSFRHGLF